MISIRKMKNNRKTTKTPPSVFIVFVLKLGTPLVHTKRNIVSYRFIFFRSSSLQHSHTFAEMKKRKILKLGRVKNISCLSSPTAPIFLPDRDLFLFFILRKTGIREGRQTIPHPFHRNVEESRRERESTSFTEHCFQSARWPIACIWVEER